MDSNVLLAAAISEGPPFEIVNMVFGGRIAIVFSRETFGELADVLMTRTPFDRISREVRAAYVGHLAERGSGCGPFLSRSSAETPKTKPFWISRCRPALIT